MNYVTLMIPVLSRRQAVWASLGLLAAVAAYAMWSGGQQPNPIAEVPPAERAQVTGVLYYSAAPLGSAYQPGVYRHSFNPAVTSGFLVEAAHAYDGLDLGYDVMVAYQEGTEDPDGYQPVWRSRDTGEVGILPHVNGYRETDMTISPDEQNYAYSFQAAADGDAYAIEDWSIAVHNYETGSYTVIPQAVEPQWTYGGTALVYLKRDGIYVYDVETSTSLKMIEKYSNLSTADDLASTPDGRYLTLALPSLNRVAIFEEQMTEGALGYVELSGIRDAQSSFRHPVVSPDGTNVAVVRVMESDFDAERGVYTKATVDVRALDTGRLIEQVVFADIEPESLRLEAWRD